MLRKRYKNSRRNKRSGWRATHNLQVEATLLPSYDRFLRGLSKSRVKVKTQTVLALLKSQTCHAGPL